MPALSFRPGAPVAACLILGAVAAFGACSSSHPSASSAGSGATTSTGARTGGSGSVANAGATTSTAAKNASTGGPDPCTLVTASDATAILGSPATATGPTEKNRDSECLYKTAGGGGFVSVLVYQGKEFYDPSVQAPTAKALAGVGDTAYLDSFGTTRTAVGFLKGDTAVFIDGFQIASPDAVTTAAQHAAAKL